MTRYACVTAVLLFCFTSVGVAASSGRSPVALRIGSKVVREAQLEGYVKQAYKKFGGFLQADDAKVEFALDDFRTITARDFDRTPYADVVSLPGTPQLQIIRIEVREARKSTMGVKYRSRLILPKQATAERWLETVNGRSFGYAISLATDEPQLLDARALTTYRVRRTVGEHTDTYRAAFLWLVDTADMSFRAYPVDPFNKGLDISLEERLEPARKQSLAVAKIDDGCAQQSKEGCDEAPQCAESSVNHSTGWQYFNGGEGHNTGGHAFGFKADFNCSCTPNCTSTCTPSHDSYCNDSQDISGIHFYHNAVGTASQDTGSSNDGLNTNTNCIAGAGCAVRECITSIFCSLSVSLSISRSGVGGSVSMTTSDGVIWQNTASAHHECAKCERYTPPPPPPPPGGGGGGDDPPPPPDSGGGGGGDWYSIDCGSDGYIDYYVWADSYNDAWDTGAELCWAE